MKKEIGPVKLMKISQLFLSILLMLFVSGNCLAEAKIKVVASIPDLADITRNIGGSLVEVKSLATGVEDPHSVPLRPSFVSLLNRADIVVSLGLGLEHAFLPGLLEAARNPRVSYNAPGHIECSAGIMPLEIPQSVDRSLGEQHPQGNPHFNLDPRKGKIIAKNIAAGLTENYPQYAEAFRSNLDTYLNKLDKWIAKWDDEARPLKGVKFISYHLDMIYLAEAYGMHQVGTIELKPGVDATPSHIAEIKELIRKENVRLLIRERQYPVTIAESLAAETGGKIAEINVMAGGTPESQTYIEAIDQNLKSLLKALQ